MIYDCGSERHDGVGIEIFLLQFTRMILLNVSEYIQMVVKGLVLAAAVGLDCMSNKRKTN